MKGEEGYATLTVGNTDFHKFSFTPRTSGTLDVTVTAHNFRPYETTIPVNANENPAVYISDLIFDDDRTGGSIGNADGQLDAGETIELAIDVKNSGKVPFNRVIGTLSCASPYISILNSQAEFGGIAANGTAQSQTKFRFRIKEDAPEIRKEDLNAIEFILKIDNGFSDFFCTDAFKIDVFAPELKMSNQFILRTMTPEVLSLSINLMNTGKAQATGLTATLLPDSSCDNVLVGPVVTASYPAIGKYETKSNATTLEFRRKNSSTVNEQLKMKLKVVNEYGKVWNLSLNPLDDCNQIDALKIKANATDKAVNLYWLATDKPTGYNIYRSDNGEAGPFVKRNTLPVLSKYYKDEDVSPLSTYYYKIAALSVTGNEGTLSAPVKVASYCPPIGGFPRGPKQRGARGLITVADVNNDGYKEILMTGTFEGDTNQGFLSIFNRNGKELFNENDALFNGLALLPVPIASSPATGNLDGNGEQNLVTATWKDDSGENTINCFSATNKNNSRQADMLWQNVIGQAHFRGPALANLDNSADGSMEVITKSNNGGIRVLTNKGSLKYNLDAKPGYSRPAIADLDRDGYKEIIVCHDTSLVENNTRYIGGGVTIWRYNGTTFTTTAKPVFGELISLSSPVICDLNNDGKKEIITVESKTGNSHIYVIDPIGNRITGWDDTQTIPYSSASKSGLDHMVSVGDINGDGMLDVVVLGTGMIRAWNYKGIKILEKRVVSLLPNNVWAANMNAPVLADVDGDSQADILYMLADKIYAIRSDGSEISGFPLYANTNFNSFNIADMDYDGKSEVIAVDEENKVYAWRTNGDANAIAWGSERHNPQNTGEYAAVCESTVIQTNTTWNGVTPCGNVIVRSGKYTIPSGKNLPLDKHSLIVVRSGATLEVDGGIISNANILAMPGGRIILKNGGKVMLRHTGKFRIEKGATFSNLNGSIE